MCQECEDGNPIIQKILDVLYATEVSSFLLWKVKNNLTVGFLLDSGSY